MNLRVTLNTNVLLFLFVFFPTFGADVSAWDAHLDAVVLHLHLVAGARSHTRVVVHHKIIWGRKKKKKH